MVGLAGAIDHVSPRTAAGQADIGHQRLTRAIHHAADDGKADRLHNMRKAIFQLFHGADHIKPLPRAGWAGNHLHAAMAQMQRFQQFPTNRDLFLRLGGKRDTQSIANAGP